MAKCDTILPLMAAMKIRPDCIGMAAETMRKMFELNIPELVVQVSIVLCVITVCLHIQTHTQYTHSTCIRIWYMHAHMNMRMHVQ